MGSPLLKKTKARRDMAGTVLTMAKTSISWKGPSRGRYWDSACATASRATARGAPTARPHSQLHPDLSEPSPQILLVRASGVLTPAPAESAKVPNIFAGISPPFQTQSSRNGSTKFRGAEISKENQKGNCQAGWTEKDYFPVARRSGSTRWRRHGGDPEAGHHRDNQVPPSLRLVPHLARRHRCLRRRRRLIRSSTSAASALSSEATRRTGTEARRDAGAGHTESESSTKASCGCGRRREGMASASFTTAVR